nr:hypothetical protein [Nostoc sp. CmiSLP01]MDZ8286006.1 hypothetical protein [Nostoc sp. ChiSLP01]
MHPLSPAPYPQRGLHLPLFPTSARSLLSGELQQALMQMGSAVYAQAASNTSSEQRQGTDDVIDADFALNK